MAMGLHNFCLVYIYIYIYIYILVSDHLEIKDIFESKPIKWNNSFCFLNVRSMVVFLNVTPIDSNYQSKLFVTIYKRGHNISKPCRSYVC